MRRCSKSYFLTNLLQDRDQAAHVHFLTTLTLLLVFYQLCKANIACKIAIEIVVIITCSWISLNKNSVTRSPGAEFPSSRSEIALVHPLERSGISSGPWNPPKAPRLRQKRMRSWASLDLASPKMDTKPGALPTQELLRKTRTYKTLPFCKDFTKVFQFPMDNESLHISLKSPLYPISSWTLQTLIQILRNLIWNKEKSVGEVSLTDRYFWNEIFDAILGYIISCCATLWELSSFFSAQKQRCVIIQDGSQGTPVPAHVACRLCQGISFICKTTQSPPDSKNTHTAHM